MKQNSRMKSYTSDSILLSVEDRPRNKMLSRGLSSITDSELVSILLSAGNTAEVSVSLATQILHSVNFNLNALAKLSTYELSKFPGMGSAKASILVASMELGRRRNQSEALDNCQIKGSKDAANYLRPEIGDLAYEEFWVLYLNRQNKVIDKQKLSQGGMTGTVIDVRLVLKSALEKYATSLIFCHNHPSGNLEPSEADKRITRQLKQAAAVMEIPVIDHLIVTQSGYFSFADEGLL
jgi:DNA repair protein RadC